MPRTLPEIPLADASVSGARIPIIRHGRNAGITTSWAYISGLAAFICKNASSGLTLRVKAGGHAADTAAGAGAREITIIGMLADGTIVREALTTAGNSASSASSNEFIRLFDCFVSASGTYVTSGSGGSHGTAITVEDSGGANDWGYISTAPNNMGHSEQGCFTVPAGYAFFLERVIAYNTTSTACAFMLGMREGVLLTSAPYKAKTALGYTIMPAQVDMDWPQPLRIPPLTDIFVMADADSGTIEINTEIHGYLTPIE